MHELIALCGFLGAWSVVAGSTLQAALELRDEEFEHDKFDELRNQVSRETAAGRVSPWWWLIPPIGFWLQRRRSKAVQREMFSRFTRSEVETLVSFGSKATGWGYVGLGGLLIAVKETWELTEALDWHPVVFWLLIVAMLLACAVNTTTRLVSGRHMVERAPAQ